MTRFMTLLFVAAALFGVAALQTTANSTHLNFYTPGEAPAHGAR